MKRTPVFPVFAAILFLTSLSVFAQQRAPARFANRVLDEVVEMSQAQLPEATILAYVRARRARLEADVTGEDLVRLHRAGVSDRVIRYIAGIADIGDAPADREERRDRDRDGDRAAGPVEPEDGAVEPAPEPYGSVYDPWPGWYGPYWDPYWGGWWGGGSIVIRGGGGRGFRGGRDGGRDGGRHDGGNRGGSRGGGGSGGRGGGGRGRH